MFSSACPAAFWWKALCPAVRLKPRVFKGDFIEGFGVQWNLSISWPRAAESGELRVRGEAGVEIVSVVPVLKTARMRALGVIISEAGCRLTDFCSIWNGLKASLGIMASILYGLSRIVATLFSEGKLMEGFVGPIGVSASRPNQLKRFYIFIQLLGLISLNLAVLNILPFRLWTAAGFFYNF